MMKKIMKKNLLTAKKINKKTPDFIEANPIYLSNKWGSPHIRSFFMLEYLKVLQHFGSFHVFLRKHLHMEHIQFYFPAALS